MSKKVSEGRRNFLKTSVAGAAGLAIVGPMAKKARGATINTATVDLTTTKINQDIDNLRVAYIQDAPAGTVTTSTMVPSTTTTPTSNWGNYNNATTGVRRAAVFTNMDKLACALAAKTDVNEAWSTIFKIPASKTWATAKVGVEVNCFASDHPSVAVVAKICRVLVGLGIQATNITLFDGQTGTGPYNGYTGTDQYSIPTGVVFDGGGKPDTIHFADGTNWSISGVFSSDIIVDIAVSKGHDRYSQFSGVTMCLKKRYGSIGFGHPDGQDAQGIVRLAKANSCDYVVGNIPSAYPAKTQLCIVDSLWLGNVGDWGGGCTAGNNANAIVMGTFPGAVDYVGTMKIRASKTGFTSGANAGAGWNQSIVDKFMTQFGFPTSANTTVMTPVSATTPGPGLVDAGATTVINPINSNLSHGNVQISVSGNGIRPFNTNLNLAQGETVRSAEIFTAQGRKIRTLGITSGSNRIVWDGKSASGSLVRPGSYVVRVKGQRATVSGEIMIGR